MSQTEHPSVPEDREGERMALLTEAENKFAEARALLQVAVMLLKDWKARHGHDYGLKRETETFLQEVLDAKWTHEQRRKTP